MGSQVASIEVAAALDSLAAALGRVRAVGLVPVDAADAAVVVRELECLGRQVDALRVGLVDEIDRRGLHRLDGHHSAKVFVRHHGNLSDLEAARRAKAMKALRDLPTVSAMFSAGRVGRDQVAVLAEAHANTRVQAALCRQDEVAARMAASMSFEKFAAMIRDWERMADQDGTADQSERNDRNRKVTLRKDPDGSWRLIGACGSVRGAMHRSILDAFLRAESDLDWAKARADKGDAATQQDLPRTDAQRAADALDEIFQAAADHFAAKVGGSRIVTNIVIDHATFERELRRLAGRPTTHQGDLPLDPDGAFGDGDGDDGDPADPFPWVGPDTDTDTGVASTADPDGDRRSAAGRGSDADRSSDLDPTGGSDLGQDDQGESDPNPDDHAHDPAQGSPPARPVGPTTPPDPISARRRPANEASSQPASRLGFRSSTIDGDAVDPSEVVAQALLGHVRRVVIGADSVVIDLGRSQRCFTGLAALAVKLANSHCTWPGCHVPATQSQSDHLQGWATGGRTDPGNGAPLCGHHNRTKEAGYRIERDEHGRLHTYRPDGTEIT